MDEAFEKAISDQHVFFHNTREGGQQKALVIANLCYNHNLIITAAEKVRTSPEYKENEKLHN